MSQNKKAALHGEPAEPSAKLKSQKPLCHVHNEISIWDNINDIREKVCVNDEDFTEYEGKYYCLFHLPTKNKSIELFNQKFRKRFEEVEKEFEEIEKLPENSQSNRNGKLRYDFRCVWFPSEISLNRYKFIASVDFSLATFTSETNFSSAIFSSSANFSSAIFMSDTYFIAAVFKFPVFFGSTIFLRDAVFRLAIFISDANFGSTIFSSDAYFGSTIFAAKANFRSAEFLETSQIFFYQTLFQKNINFKHAIVKGYIYFEAGTEYFLDEKWIDTEKRQPKLVQRKTSVFEGDLDFAHVRAEKPERITFNKARLCPNWFVNIDSRKFVFTDINWENHHAEKEELRRELESLSERDYTEPHNFRLLTIAFRNLAANAEEFNRFEEASNFRKSASECERLERLNRQKGWKQNLKKLWNRNIFCRRFFVEAYLNVKESLRILLREKKHTDTVHFLYRHLSFYGEKWSRAFWWLFGIWLFFALAYYFFGEFGTEDKKEYLELAKSFGYSLMVMTLQRPEPRPLSGFTLFLYGMETILAPLQAALIALAIRRKFMR